MYANKRKLKTNTGKFPLPRESVGTKNIAARFCLRLFAEKQNNE